MLLLFQILFTAFIIIALLTVYKRRGQSLLGPKGAFFWVVFWLSALVLVWWPESSSSVAKFLGIGRGADLVLYTSIAVLFFLLFRLHVKIESIGRSMTKVTREQALLKEQLKK